MARPIDKSLYSFPHDTDARGDRKHKRFIRYTGLPGYGFYWGILEDIYNEHYFLEWTSEDKEAFIAEFDCPHFELDEQGLDFIVEKAMKFGLLNKELYDQYGIFTSASIQARWLKQSNRRILAEMRKDFLLINVSDFYQKELKNNTLSIKVVDENGDTLVIYGDYTDDDNGNHVNDNNNPDNVDNNVDNSNEYDEDYGFHCDYPWDGEQPIDYVDCIEKWNAATGGQARTSRIPKSKKIDLRRVFRNYTGQEAFGGLTVRCEDETLKDSKYMTDWSTLFGAKRLENLDKWVGRWREWKSDQSKMESVQDHLNAGWKTQKQAEKLSAKSGVEFEDPMFWETKKVESQLLYYPKFSH